jgi:hypothetical protein
VQTPGHSDPIAPLSLVRVGTSERKRPHGNRITQVDATLRYLRPELPDQRHERILPEPFGHPPHPGARRFKPFQASSSQFKPFQAVSILRGRHRGISARTRRMDEGNGRSYVSVAVPSLTRPVGAKICLCHACFCHDIVSTHQMIPRRAPSPLLRQTKAATYRVAVGVLPAGIRG